MLRNQAGLQEALDGVRRLRRDALPRLYCRARDRVYSKEWADAVECRSLLDTLEATALSAIRRNESRGAHYREDHPAPDQSMVPWNGFVTMIDGEMNYRTRPAHTHRLAPSYNASPVKASV
jgi:succinate dehydrogenase/fumarate reductase flavoprotein subunit